METVHSDHRFLQRREKCLSGRKKTQHNCESELKYCCGIKSHFFYPPILPAFWLFSSVHLSYITRSIGTNSTSTRMPIFASKTVSHFAKTFPQRGTGCLWWLLCLYLWLQPWSQQMEMRMFLPCCSAWRLVSFSAWWNQLQLTMRTLHGGQQGELRQPLPVAMSWGWHLSWTSMVLRWGWTDWAGRSRRWLYKISHSYQRKWK